MTTVEPSANWRFRNDALQFPSAKPGQPAGDAVKMAQVVAQVLAFDARQVAA
jgi:hypothetical protein